MTEAGYTPSPRKIRYLELDALRGLIILAIYFNHWHFADASVLLSEGAATRISFFFILSGFVLCAAFGRRIGNGSLDYGKFMSGRLGKIWPLATLVSVFAFTFMHYHCEPGWEWRMAAQVFMVSTWVPDIGFVLSGNSPSWFLSDILLFYVLFPLLFRWMEKRFRPFLAITLIFVLLSVILSCLPGLNQDHEAQYWVSLFPPVRLVQCMAGMCIWHITTKRRQISRVSVTLKPVWVSLIWLFWIGLYAIVCLTADDVGRGLYYTVTSVLAGALLLCINAVFRGSGSVIMRLLRSRPMQWLGSVSFCVYLIHMPIVEYAEFFNDSRGWGMDQYMLSVITLMFVVVIAWLIDRLFVRPLSRYIDRRLDFRKDTAPVL